MSIGQLPQSFRGYVGLAKESTYGTGVAPSTFVDATSDGFALDNQVDYQNTTRGRATYKGEAGAFSDEGGFDMPAAPENGLGLILLAVFGNEDFTDNTTYGTHAFNPAETLPSLSVEVDRDTDTVRHLGCGVDTLELSHTAEDVLTASVDVIAQEPDGSVSSASPTYSDLRNFRWHDIGLTVNGNSREADVTEATFSISNNLEANYRGSRSLGKLGVGERPITATLSLDFETTDLFEQFLGAASATSPQDQLTDFGVQATWTSPETIDGSQPYSLDWNMPKCTVNTHEATINQNDNVIEDVELRALYDSGLGAEAEVTLENGVQSAY